MRAKITVTEVGKSETLSGGATKLSFMAQNGKGQVIPCITFKSNIQSEVKAGAVLDVDYDELNYATKEGDQYQVYKAWGLYKENGQPPESPILPERGTWREEKAAEVIGNLLCSGVIKESNKLARKLYKWLDNSLPNMDK